jgi:hypothetical protein
MHTVEMLDYRGFDMVEVLSGFEEKYRIEVWKVLYEHPVYKSIEDNGMAYGVVSGLWLRKFLGHVAIDTDYLSEYRRNYPPLTDSDLIFIRNYSLDG